MTATSHEGTRPAHRAGCTSCQSPQQKSSSSKTDRRVLRFYCYTDKYEKEYEKVRTNKQAAAVKIVYCQCQSPVIKDDSTRLFVGIMERTDDVVREVTAVAASPITGD